MSHELRSPLNSLLLACPGLIQNKEGNLTEEQVTSAEIIHGSGRDLLNLIDETLDLSKIEAGRMEIHVGALPVNDLVEGLRSSFSLMAEKKGLGLDISIHEDAPAEIVSDRKRMEQVLRNLVSNAIKFTETGSVAIHFGRPGSRDRLVKKRAGRGRVPGCDGQRYRHWHRSGKAENHFRGLPAGGWQHIKEVRRNRARTFISRELTLLLGGEIQLESKPGQGATFTLYLPVNSSEHPVPTGDAIKGSKGASNPSHPLSRPKNPGVQIEDDRENLEQDDRIILVIEDDADFAGILYRKCHERGFKCLAASTGEAGLELAVKYLPSAIILDIRLPGMDGWAVLNTLKDDIRTRHIPVHVASVEDASAEAFRKAPSATRPSPWTWKISREYSASWNMS